MDEVNVIRIRRLLKTETDAELTRDLQTLIAQRDAALKQAGMLAEEIDTIEAELARRQLAAYWLAHPELTAVAAGDKLLVTGEFMECKKGLYRVNPIEWNLGVQCVVVYVNIYEGAVDFGGASTGGVPLLTLVAMRRAYLESEVTK